MYICSDMLHGTNSSEGQKETFENTNRSYSINIHPSYSFLGLTPSFTVTRALNSRSLGSFLLFWPDFGKVYVCVENSTTVDSLRTALSKQSRGSRGEDVLWDSLFI